MNSIVNILHDLLGFSEKCLPSIFVGIVLHILYSKPIFINISLILPILIILLVVIISLFRQHKERIINYFRGLMREPLQPNEILKTLIGPLILGILLGFILAQTLIPIFEITSPKEGRLVNQIINVGGHGAIPGSEIEIFVVDNLGHKWTPGTTFSEMKGNWELYPVYIGEPGDKDRGKRYEIYALLKTPGQNYSTKHIQVTRSSD